jgi:hypothetical protein
MSNLDKLVELGAYSCAGDLIFNNKLVGTLRNGDLHLTDEGRKLLDMDISDAVVLSETPAPAVAPSEPVALDDVQIEI